jgi:hypothetical protein
MAGTPEGPAARFDRYLVPGESLVFAVHRHLAILLRPLGLVLAAFALMLALIAYLPRGLSILAEVGVWITGAMVLYLAWQVIERRREFFVVTDQRLLLVGGLIETTVATMPLGKVTDLRYERSLSGHLLGYGRFVLESAGQEQALREIDYVAHPDRAYRVVVALVFGLTPDPHDVDELVAGDWRRVGLVRRFDEPTAGGAYAAGTPHHRPATDAGSASGGSEGSGGSGFDRRPQPAPDAVGPAGINTEEHSRAIPMVGPTGRAETLFRSADLQARLRSADTGAVPRATWTDPTDD